MADYVTLEEVNEEMLPHVDGTDTHTRVPVVKMQGWADAIDAAIKQREQDAKDAARYRWLLRDVGRAVDLLTDADLTGTPGYEISDEIDSAMAKECGNG